MSRACGACCAMVADGSSGATPMRRSRSTRRTSPSWDDLALEPGQAQPRAAFAQARVRLIEVQARLLVGFRQVETAVGQPACGENRASPKCIRQAGACAGRNRCRPPAPARQWHSRGWDAGIGFQVQVRNWIFMLSSFARSVQRSGATTGARCWVEAFHKESTCTAGTSKGRLRSTRLSVTPTKWRGGAVAESHATGSGNWFTVAQRAAPGRGWRVSSSMKPNGRPQNSPAGGAPRKSGSG